MSAAVTVLDVLDDPHLFAGHFAPREAWVAWRTVLRALFGLPMTPEDVSRYRAHTGRRVVPTAPAPEAWFVVGRRGGKSRIAALVAVYLGAFRDYREILAPGERATVMVIAADRRQARVVVRYVTGLLEGVPMLARLVTRRTAEALHLANRVTVEVHTKSYRAVRGYTVVAAVCDEVAFWPTDESANPDTEIIGALRPATGTVPGALLLSISSPYARRGVLWDAYRTHFGQDGDPALVWQADSRAMNPTLAETVVQAAYAADPAAAAAEYGAEFRRDIEGFVLRDAVDACVVPGRRAWLPVAGVHYVGFVDPSGGAADAMTLAIAHRDGDTVVLDALYERRPPFSPEAVTAEFAATLKAYHVLTVAGDRYGGEWPRERFRAHGIGYTLAAQAKSDLYRELLPLVTSHRAALLDHPRLVAQLVGLERRTARGGRDTIDHAPGGHDDLANAAAGALVLAGRPPGGPLLTFIDDTPNPTTPEEWAELERRQQRALWATRGWTPL